ncbi:ion transporter [Tepidamorphus sp. 3E244]|uniref:ion transporter n=1 Tax=Tepidamorphus sp. 3E244 TaxID=3385498 RepID=UPI0038FD1B19
MSLHGRALRMLKDPRFDRTIMVLIIINAITLGLETSKTAMENFGPLLVFLDRAILAIFVAELALKMFAYRGDFFRGPWRIFDLVIVSIALIPATENFSVLRALRVLRVLRMISVVPSLRRVVGALVYALPGMASIILLLSLVFYVFSVMATKLYGETFPEWFGSIGASLYTLFQVMTLESWSMGIVRPVMDEHPLAWIFFVPFILVTSFAVLNLFIGIIVNAMQSEHEDTAHAEREALQVGTTALHEEVRELRKEILSLRQLISATRKNQPKSG